MTSTALRVVVAEDNYLVREGIRLVLDKDEDVDVVEYCADGTALVNAIERHDPDVVVTDVRMPPTHTNEGIRVAVDLRDRRPETGVVVISQYAEPEYLLELFEHGSDRRAYLLKEHVGNAEQLVGAIRAVAEGGSVVDPHVVEVLVEARMHVRNSPLLELTPRERDVLAGLAEGKSNAAIANSLFLTKRAVEKNINAIFTKLGMPDDRDVSRRVVAALMFLSE